eukprot:5776764-Prymnesium_polylepis.2
MGRPASAVQQRWLVGCVFVVLLPPAKSSTPTQPALPTHANDDAPIEIRNVSCRGSRCAVARVRSAVSRMRQKRRRPELLVCRSAATAGTPTARPAGLS